MLDNRHFRRRCGISAFCYAYLTWRSLCMVSDAEYATGDRHSCSGALNIKLGDGDEVTPEAFAMQPEDAAIGRKVTPTMWKMPSPAPGA